MDRKSIPTKYEIQAKERIRILIDEYCEGSQQRLSDRSGVGKASISQYVNGKNIPSNLTAKKLCEPFGINPAWLMGFDVPMNALIETPCISDLTPEEVQLISNYQRLNFTGQSMAQRYVEDLTEQKKYTEDGSSRSESA